VVLLCALFSMIAFRFRPGRERSPFSLFGMTPGMSLGQLRDVVARRNRVLECHATFDVYQRCFVHVQGSSGMLVAIVDPSNRVIIVHGLTMGESEELHAEADSVRASWSHVAPGKSVPPLVGIGDTGAVRWTSIDERWTAEQHFSGQEDPDPATQVILVDTKGLDRLVARSNQAEQEAKASGWTPPTAEEAQAAIAELKANRVSDYRALATSLSQLSEFETAYRNEHQSYTDNIAALQGMVVPGHTLLEIPIATDSGWTAKASTPAIQKVSCIATGGRVSASDLPVTAQGRGITSSSGVICDPMP